MRTRVPEDHRVTRFIASKKNMSVVNGRVKRHEFMPSFMGGVLALSVFRTHGIGEEAVWAIADQHIPRSIVGRGALTARDIDSAGLELQVDDSPPGHATVINWPASKEAAI